MKNAAGLLGSYDSESNLEGDKVEIFVRKNIPCDLAITKITSCDFQCSWTLKFPDHSCRAKGNTIFRQIGPFSIDNEHIIKQQKAKNGFEAFERKIDDRKKMFSFDKNQIALQ